MNRRPDDTEMMLKRTGKANTLQPESACKAHCAAHSPRPRHSNAHAYHPARPSSPYITKCNSGYQGAVSV